MEPAAYPELADAETRHWWFVARRAILAAVLAELGIRDARLLEVGSGTGGNLGVLERLGRVWAIEPDAGARRVAGDRHPRVRHLSSLDDLPGNIDGAFDVALLLDVLEHLAEPVDTLVRVREWVVPGGYLVLTVPAHPLLFGAHDRFLHHVRRYREHDLRAQLGDAGWQITHLTPLNAVSLLPAGLLRMAEAMTPNPAASRGMTVPPALVNAALARIFSAERWLVPTKRLPFGLSLLAIARVPT